MNAVRRFREAIIATFRRFREAIIATWNETARWKYALILVAVRFREAIIATWNETTRWKYALILVAVALVVIEPSDGQVGRLLFGVCKVALFAYLGVLADRWATPYSRPHLLSADLTDMERRYNEFPFDWHASEMASLRRRLNGAENRRAVIVAFAMLAGAFV